MEKRLVIFVEGETDAKIVTPILKAAKFPTDKIKVISASGKVNAIKLAEKYQTTKSPNELIAVLVDADEMTIPDAESHWQKQMVEKNIALFYAIPEIEAWLFADDKLLKKHLNGNAEKVLNRLVLPEQIVYPKAVAAHLFKKHNDWSFLEGIDVNRAAARSASLNHFLTRIGRILDIQTTFTEHSVASNIDRKVFANLIKEVMPSDTVVFKTMDGTKITAQEMLQNIEEGTDLSKDYTSDLLRIARDFLKRQANKSTVSV